MMYRDIMDLAKQEGGCVASNKHFGQAYGVPVRTIKRWLTALDEAGYIDRSGRGTARSITLSARWNNPATSQEKGPLVVPLERAIGGAIPQEKGPLVVPEKGPLVVPDYIETITESVESRAHVGAPAREAPTDNDNNNSSSTDLSFLPAKDLERYEEAIRETLSLIPSDQQQPEVLKARTWGRGMGMNPAEWRAMNRTIKELGWIKTVAACTIASSLNVPLAKIDSVTSQWQKSYHEHEWAPNANAVYEDWEL